jgi:hypothetical protein
MKALLATQLLPASMIGKFGAVGRFVNENVVPLVGLSGAVIQGISGSAAPSVSDTSDSEIPLNNSSTHGQDIRLDDPQIVDELRKHIMKFMYAESVDGVSQDTQLFLKRSVSWNTPGAVWNDFDDAVQLLSRTISQENGGNRLWAIDCFHAQRDQLVGEKGKTWFNDIWASGQGYQYRCEDVKGTEHDFLMDPAFGASDVWLQRVGAIWQNSGLDAETSL